MPVAFGRLRRLLDGSDLRRFRADVQEGSGLSDHIVGGCDDPGLLIYERVLPAIPASVARIRHELIDSLALHEFAVERHDDASACP